MRASIFVIVFAVLGFSATGSEAPTHSASFTLPFELIDNRVFIEVRLNGHGPYHFILDTGAAGTVSDQVAQELGLKVEDAGAGQGVGEGRYSSAARRLLRFTSGS